MRIQETPSSQMAIGTDSFQPTSLMHRLNWRVRDDITDACRFPAVLKPLPLRSAAPKQLLYFSPSTKHSRPISAQLPRHSLHHALPRDRRGLLCHRHQELEQVHQARGRPPSLRVSAENPTFADCPSLLQFKLKPFGDRDVDIAIDACGVCASDVHTITGGWGSDIPLPLCVGHEIIGKVVKVGKDVTTIKEGDRVGVGAQIGADLTCGNCKADQENYCPNSIDTYGAPYPDGTISMGGYSSHVRAHEYFTFKIPDALETSLAAPMLCAGLTVFSPLKRLGAGPGKKIGIVGM